MCRTSRVFIPHVIPLKKKKAITRFQVMALVERVVSVWLHHPVLCMLGNGSVPMLRASRVMFGSAGSTATLRVKLLPEAAV